jgi:hypothetical protein
MQKFIDMHVLPTDEYKDHIPAIEQTKKDKTEVFSSGPESPRKLEYAWSTSDDVTDDHIPELDGWDRKKNRVVVEEESSSYVDMKAINATLEAE